MFNRKEATQIVLYLKEQKLSQEKLAKKVGISRQYVSALLNRRESNFEREQQIREVMDKIGDFTEWKKILN